MILSVALAALLLSSAVVSAQGEGGVSLKLTPVARRSDVHPLVLYQQHLNHANARHARMLGRSYDRELAHEHVKKRIVKVGGAHTLSMSAEEMEEMMKHLKRDVKDEPLMARAGNGTSGAKNSAGFSPDALKAAIAGGVTQSTAPTAENSLGYAIEASDVGYLSTIAIGTPPKDYLFLMDSGSSDTWVPSQACTGCGTHTTLGSNTSSTFVALTLPFQVTYGSGAVAGMIASDVMTIGGASLTRPIGVALQESIQFSSPNTPFDGLVGLAQSGLSEQKVATPPEAFAKAGKLPSSAMSYALGRIADGVNTGQITFGGRDAARSDAASLVTVDVASTNGFWEVALDNMAVNGAKLGFASRTAILDTGTTLMILPPADAAAVHAAIPGSKSDGQGGFTIPCTSTAVVSMSFGGKSFDIDPRDTTFLPVDDTKLAGDCVSGIGSGLIGANTQFLVGDVFLKNVYMTTDVQSNTVTLSKLIVPAGLAAAAPSTPAASSSSPSTASASSPSAAAPSSASASIAPAAASASASVKAIASSPAAAAADRVEGADDSVARRRLFW